MPIHNLIHLLTRQYVTYANNQTPSPIPMPIHNLIHLLTRQCYLRKQSNAVTDTDAYPHPDSSPHPSMLPPQSNAVTDTDAYP
jgi:hypothetical protein